MRTIGRDYCDACNIPILSGWMVPTGDFGEDLWNLPLPVVVLVCDGCYQQRQEGGTRDLDNLQVLCTGCNGSKWNHV
jgi:hypothetical protein